jgi:hypothetical protein
MQKFGWFFIFGIAIAMLGAAPRAEKSVAHHPWMFNRNLVVNDSFDDDLGSLDMEHVVKPSNWSTDGYATVLQYGGLDGLPTVGDHDESIFTLHGKNFLGGGPGRQNNVAKAWQRIDLYDAIRRIRKGVVTYRLSASLGGRSAKADFAKVWIRFFDDEKQQLSAPVGMEPVLRSHRNGMTRFLRRACYDVVPPAARYAQISVGMYKLSGSANHGYIDDVAFVLRDDGKHNPQLARCAASSSGNPEELLTKARTVDDGSRYCVQEEQIFVSLLIGLMVFLITLCMMFADEPRHVLAIAGWASGSDTSRMWRYRLAGIFGAIAWAMLAAVVSDIVLSAMQALSYSECGLHQYSIPAAWTFYPLAFCSLVGFDVLAATVVFVPWEALHPKKLWRCLCIRCSIFIAAGLAALAFLVLFTPAKEELDRLDALALIFVAPLSYMWLAARRSITSLKMEVKGGIALLLLLPVFQPALAMWNLHVIHSQRIHHELEHRYFDVDVGGDHARFTGVLFHTPTELDYQEPGRVVFSAHLVGVTDRSPRSCIFPRFSAPGFTVQEMAADAVSLSQRDVEWDWVVKPRQDGRQFFFINVLYSPSCRHSTPTPGGAGDGFASLFSQTDSAWVSHEWFSVEDVPKATPFLTLVGLLIAVVVGILDLGVHMKRGKDDPKS